MPGLRFPPARSLAVLVSAGAALIVAAGLLAAPADAALLVYEPFDYAQGTVLDDEPATGLGLAGEYAANGALTQQQLVVSGPGLGYGSLLGTPSATGLRAGDVAGVTAAGAHVSLDQAVAVGPDETIYWSALFSLDDRNNRNRFASITLHDDVTGDTLFFGEPVVGIGGLRVAASTVATGGLVSDGADAAFADGSTILLVGLYRNSATPGGDLLQLLSYDTASAIQLPGFFDPSDPNAAASFSLSGLDIDFSQITSITFDIRGTDDKFIDELRIGTTWGSVIPEPASASLLLLGLGALCGKARARRAGRRRA